MSENAGTSTIIVDKTANAAPLGFTGLGLAAVLLSLSYIGVYPVGSMIVSMAIFLGGFAQVFAGIMCWKKGDVFAGTAFSAFGLFWFSLAGLIVMPAMGWIEASSGMAMAAYLFIWGVYTFVMLIITMKIGVRALQLVFVNIIYIVYVAGRCKRNRKRRTACSGWLRWTYFGPCISVYGSCHGNERSPWKDRCSTLKIK